MPVANCVVADDRAPDPAAVVRLWSRAAGIGADEMTVNLVHATQGGRRYTAMAQLLLPSVWRGDDIERLSVGLARALAEATGAEPSAVQVITTVLTSGSVVEGGRIVHW